MLQAGTTRGVPRRKFDPELFSRSAYVQNFCDIHDKSAVLNILQQNDTILIKEMDREGGNKEEISKCREGISLHFLILSPIPHFLSIFSPFLNSLSISSSFSHSLPIVSQPGCHNLCNPAVL